MKHRLHSLFKRALCVLQQQGDIPSDVSLNFTLERTRDAKHGDFACNAAMVLAKPCRLNPRALAEKLVAALPQDEVIAQIEIAGAGFVNVFLTATAYQTVIQDVLQCGARFGMSQMGAGKRVLVEFVSANPTGPLHVGHGRGAAYGAALADLLAVAGYVVHREYYVNDAGRQMDILATSIWLRYLLLCGEFFDFPSNGYKGDYIATIAEGLLQSYGRNFYYDKSVVYMDVPADAPVGDKEVHIDALIVRCKQLLGEGGYQAIFQQGLAVILADIRQDLEEFGVIYEEWFSELSLRDKVKESIDQLTAGGHTYVKEGALWFRSTAFGDEKDRVIVRDNGQYTYLASDIAYHINKLQRGFDELVNIWGADHHGYISRVRGSLKAAGYEPNRLTILLVQFATLYRGQERMQMSTRSGEFITLRELRAEVGRDAARFFYVQRKCEQHLDFDLELAKSQSNDNPVYYIQYAHARIASVFRQLADKEWVWEAERANLHLLTEGYEQQLQVTLARYPEVIESAAQAYEPHQLAYYLRELAQAFHTYYNAVTFLVEDAALRNARLNLIAATQQVLRNGLIILGVSAPDVM